MDLKVKIRSTLFDLIKWSVGVIPKNKKLILFSAWFGEKYADNTMYLFEYMLKNSKYDVYWYTKNGELYKTLQEKGIPVVWSKTLKAKWYQARAIILLSTVQTSDYHPLLFNKCILLDLDHGFPGKPVGLAQPTADDEWKRWYNFKLKGVDFYQTASSRFVANFLSPCYDIPYDHYVFANKPRIDVLFDTELQKGKNPHIVELKKNHKIVSYLPTHRDCGRIPIPITEIMDLDSIQEVCEKHDTLFLIKKHFYHRLEKEDLSRYKNIIDITHEDIDTQVLLAQSDALVTDFSSCYNDYLALNRPIIFYAFDYEHYIENDRDYYWKYDKIEAGFTSTTKEGFTEALKAIVTDWNDTLHEKGRLAMRGLYFDKSVEMGTSRKKHVEIITDLINKTYVPFNWMNLQ